jgi:hypothetical protein
MYADDTVLFFADKDCEVINRVLTAELEKLNIWLLENKLFLNQEKTETVLFGSNANLGKASNYQPSINGSVINQVTEYKYLGVILSGNLSWNAHIEDIVSRVGKRLGMLRRLRRNITMHAAETIYKSFIRPVMEYCDSVWVCCGKLNMDKLDKLQRRAARTVTRITRSDEALSCLRWENLELRRDRHVFNLVHKCIAGKSPQFLNNYFTFNRDIVSRMTRQSNKLHLPKVRTECAKNSFYYYGCKVYNRLSG